MARGFESKDVEYQQSEAERRVAFRPALSAEQRERKNQRCSLNLALARARSEFDAANSPAHRRMLEQAIAALEQQLLSRP